MSFNVASFVALAAFGIGFAAYWSNSNRTINRCFGSASLHVALWLICHNLAVDNVGPTGQFWLRVTSAVGAFLPFHLWFVKEAIARGLSPLSARWKEVALWMTACAVLAGLTTTEWFVAKQSSREAPGFGWAYNLHNAGIVVAYATLCFQAIRQVRRLSGVNRLELQIVLLGACATAGAVLILIVARVALNMPVLVNMQPLVVLVFYAGMVVAINTHRIFDARQILVVAGRNALLVVIVALAALVMQSGFDEIVPEPFGLLATTALALWLAAVLNDWLSRIFNFYPEAVSARQAAYTAARMESRREGLEAAFLSVLKGWGQADHALILLGTKDGLQGCGLELPGDATVVRALRQFRWVTPERLTRESATPERVELAEFLHEHELGVLVIGEGPTLTALIGVGVAASRRPFTYPQVAQLNELASIIESAMERAYFSVKVQHAEQLATVGLLGASLAHEIRNPLVSIKTFVQLLPTHYHDPAFREKFFRLIGHEVDRIDRLTVQLLELASPRAYQAEEIELHPVLRASVDLIASKAAEKKIEFHSDFAAKPDLVISDASAAKQVMLNLCFNAIQAVEAREGARWVRVATRNVSGGVEMSVADSGPGISPEIRPRLFQPFQSTKSTGFGLGLAICSDILANLNASISVDPYAPGAGATFRVVFPCQPSSS
jgi:signal transduction histidine kinase